jgi:hypothetical protein
MIKSFLLLRLNQAQRIFKSVGLFYGIILGFIFVLVQYTLFYHTKSENEQYTTLALLGAIITIHFSRNDKKIIEVVLNQKSKILYLLEYNLLILPFSISLLFGETPYIFFILHICVTILPLLKAPNSIHLNGNSFLIFKFLPYYLFEWRAGLRKNQLTVVFLYLLTLILGYWYFSSFIILGLLTFSFSAYYNEFEPRNILLLFNGNAKAFIWQKMKSHLTFYILFISPILVLYFVKYPKYSIFYIPLLICYILNFLVFLLNKYKSYIPNEYNNSNTGILIMIFFGMFLPYFFPISTILVFIFYKKSITNLNQYLNAGNQ